MKRVVMAWVGETMTGHGTAVCVECGWFTSNPIYARVALSALSHEESHPAKEGE